MKLPEIIAIGGTNGAGKDTLAELVANRKVYKNVSLSDILRVELDRRGMSHERENMRAVSTQWRQKYGNDAFARLTLDAYYDDKAKGLYNGLAVTSLRHPGVVQAFKDVGALVVWVDADRQIRYDRVVAAARGRVDDVVSFEEFCQQEDDEMYPPTGDPHALDTNGVRLIADVVIQNDFSSRAEYEKYLLEQFEL